jgi:AraC family transcriptional regulator
MQGRLARIVPSMGPDAFSQDTRRAEYAARFNRVVDHIQAHLAEPMALETLASVACFSPYHFHRLFHGWMGETVHAFILRLRVERAATQLIHNPRKSITEIALDCGFSSSSTFARAFKAFHGLSASEWRQIRKIRKADRKDCEAGHPGGDPSLESNDECGPEPIMNLQVEVQQLPPMHVAYVRHVGSFQENTTLFERLFGRLCGWACARGLLGPDTKFLSIYHDNPEITDAQRLRLDVAITIPDHTKVEGEIGKQKLEGGSYAVARVRIHPSQYGEAWDALLGGWLPGSGYQPDDRPCFEFTLKDPKTDPEGMHDVDLCLAVRTL